MSIGEGTLMGAGSTVIQNLSIGAWATVGAGAVVVTDLDAAVTAVGIPARPRPGATAASPGRVQPTRQVP